MTKLRKILTLLVLASASWFLLIAGFYLLLGAIAGLRG